MGLDNLIDDEEESNDKQEWGSLTGSKSSSSKSGNFSKPSITDNTVGPYGYKSQNEFEETIQGELNIHEDLFKYHLPIFPHIENEQKYMFGGRYKITSENNIIVIGGKISCIYMRNVVLSNLPRELIMLDTGETEKNKCYSVLEDRFDETINDNTEIYLYLFMRTRHITKMAIGDEQVDSWSTYPKDKLIKAIFGETYTQDFREVAGGPPDLKHIDQIGIWETADEFTVDK